MHTVDHILIGAAASIPVPPPQPISSYVPVVLRDPSRRVDLELKITFPAHAGAAPHPVILFSHGQGRSNNLSSLEGYAPLAEFWASRGFAVIQPTHLSSASLGIAESAPRGSEGFWHTRAEDMVKILDNLDYVESVVPGLTKGALDRGRIAAVGHSAGGLTTCLLLGMENTDPRDGKVYANKDERVKAGIVLAGVGRGGESLSESGKARFPYYGPEFGTMSTPALVVYGDIDVLPMLSDRSADWHADAYSFAPAPKDLLVLKGAHHTLGGVSGWDVAETLDGSMERLSVVQRMTWAYLRSQLFEGDSAWVNACKAFDALGDQGSLERK